MIYQLYCGLIMVGYAACSTLLGSYMYKYAGAREADLGWIFMVQPFTIFCRPLICAHSDRRQSHKQMLAFYAFLTSLAYFPFIIYPFLEERLEGHLGSGLKTSFMSLDLEDAHNKRLLFWILIVFHLVGSIGWCGVRSLGDALAVNYAKRIGTDFARYRKYGSISYGVCNFFLGFYNQDWWLPDYVPAMGAYSVSMIVLGLLVYAWPDEYFMMSSENNEDERVRIAYIESLPSAGQTLKHIACKLFACCGQPEEATRERTSNKINRSPSSEQRDLAQNTNANQGQQFSENLASVNRTICLASSESAWSQPEKSTGGQKVFPSKSITSTSTSTSTNEPQPRPSASHQKLLTVRQQMRIFGLLIKRDFRIILYLLIILYGGLTGYSGPNFVFTYMNQVCHERGTCKGSQLAGIVMLGYCFVETSVYMLVDRYRHSLNRTLMLELTFLALAVHYYFYGFLLEHLSPYFFLVESLHGIEYGISLTASVDMGYYFAREVELLLPELEERNIISEEDDQELVKVSLLATMSGCYTLAYDGFGTILGCLIYGQILSHYGFTATWISIGSSAAAGFVVIAIGYTLGKCFGIRPEILRIRDRQLALPNRELGR